MEEDLKDEDIPEESNEEGNEKSKEERAASFTRRQILNMGWSVPVAFGLAAMLPKMADGDAKVVWGDRHYDSHTDSHDDTHTDSGKSRGSERINPDFRQALSQDILQIKRQINGLQTKLNMAREGQPLNQLSGRATNLKGLFQTLVDRLNAQIRLGGTGNLRRLSAGASNAIIIINGLEQKIGAKSKGGSLEQLNQLNINLTGFESDLNSL